jgi:hypothetical protein
MPRVHVVDSTHLPPERVLAAGRDFTARRADLWPDVHVEHLHVHEQGPDYAVVTEGNPWPIGLVWERLRYDWSQPHALKGVVIDSNLFHPGSTWELHATPTGEGSRVEIIAVRRLRPLKGWLTWPFFPTGLARRDVAAHLRHFLSTLERDSDRLSDEGRRSDDRRTDP